MEMTITAIITTALVAFCSLIAAMLGHSVGKSSGAKEGAAQATDQINAQQAEKAVEAVKERSNVDQAVASATDDDLDQRMRDFYRKDDTAAH